MIRKLNLSVLNEIPRAADPEPDTRAALQESSRQILNLEALGAAGPDPLEDDEYTPARRPYKARRPLIDPAGENNTAPRKNAAREFYKSLRGYYIFIGGHKITYEPRRKKRQ